jgi:hypothetical protein
VNRGIGHLGFGCPNKLGPSPIFLFFSSFPLSFLFPVFSLDPAHFFPSWLTFQPLSLLILFSSVHFFLLSSAFLSLSRAHSFFLSTETTAAEREAEEVWRCCDGTPA